jgi:uncharacterized membrane protein YedE/YeeE
MDSLLETYGDAQVLLAAGAIIGILFGIAAQRSKFCLRASTVELAHGQIGPRSAIWLLAFFTALFVTQFSIVMGWLSLSDARQLSGVGSLSGAIIGGLMFGVGMILARGCASRLLVLSATGNLRALITGLVLTLVAQAALTGFLATPREALSALWLINGPSRDLMQVIGVSREVVTFLAMIGLIVSVGVAWLHKLPVLRILYGATAGLAVALGWIATYTIAQASFDVVPVSSITFTGPATDTLMAFATERSVPLSFGLGLVPGVFIGAGLAAVLSGEWKLERFTEETPTERYMIGAVLMGFGAMLAGGCAVGAAIAGGSALSLTAWVAGLSIWAGGIGMTWALDRLGARTGTAVA